MARLVILLRGINLPGHKRVVMSELREVLAQAGFLDVATYVNSGNVILSSDAGHERVARDCERVLKTKLGHDIQVVVRSGRELAEVVGLNPLRELAVQPKRYLVTFLAGEPSASAIERLRAAAIPPEQLVIAGREIYSWHPPGLPRMPLWDRLARQSLGATATSRNWTTVMKLSALVGES
jgi:uncharacterized protein (DUF1697 family)